MPVDQKKYPKNWKAIVAAVRARSGDTCECRGECGTAECQRQGQCYACQGERHPVTRSKVILTTAHLDHGTHDNRLENLRHMCQRCHLNLDKWQHGANAKATRLAKQATAAHEAGQRSLLEDL
jgi:hypothetical protein